MRSTKSGLAFASLAVALWSTSGPVTYFVGQQLSVWQLLAISSGIGAVVQTTIYASVGRRIRTVLLPPPLLWLPMLGGFVVTVLAYACAVTSSKGTQVVGVNLVNYLWPTLTVALAAWLVPNSRLRPRLLVAVALALGGLAAGNWGAIVQWAKGDCGLSPAPYVLAAAAALAWAGYSALLSRWNGWARDHATAPSGFAIVCLVSLCVCLATGQWRSVPAGLWPVLLFGGVGPYAMGYMSWELALHRASPLLLGLLASAIPLLSTVWLLVILALGAGGRLPDGWSVLRLAFAGLLIASAIAVNATGDKPRASAHDLHS